MLLDYRLRVEYKYARPERKLKECNVPVPYRIRKTLIPISNFDFTVFTDYGLGGTVDMYAVRVPRRPAAVRRGAVPSARGGT